MLAQLVRGLRRAAAVKIAAGGKNADGQVADVAGHDVQLGGAVHTHGNIRVFVNAYVGPNCNWEILI